MRKHEQAVVSNDTEMQDKINTMKKTARIQLIAFAVLLAIGLTPVIWTAATGNDLQETPPAIMAAVVVLISAGSVMFILSVRTENKLKAFVSVNITHNLLAEVFEVDEYNHGGSVSLDGVRASGLVDDWDRCGGAGDLMRGKYKGRGISFSDMKLERRAERKNYSTKEKEDYWETVFEGIWIFLEHDRDVASPLRVRERSAFGGGNSIETENAAFNNQFQILTQDGHTAFLILTPQFMEYLVSADAKARGVTKICFSGNTTCIAIANNRNNFESPGKYKDIEKIREAQRGEIRYLTAILDELLKNDYLYGCGNPTGKVSEQFAAVKDREIPIANGGSQAAEEVSKAKVFWGVLRSFHPLGVFLLAVYAISAVFTLVALPYGVVLSSDIYDPAAALCPTWLYLLVLTVFVVMFSFPLLLLGKGERIRRIPTRIAGSVLLILIHVWLVMANING